MRVPGPIVLQLRLSQRKLQVLTNLGVDRESLKVQSTGGCASLIWGINSNTAKLRFCKGESCSG